MKVSPIFWGCRVKEEGERERDFKSSSKVGRRIRRALGEQKVIMGMHGASARYWTWWRRERGEVAWE